MRKIFLSKKEHSFSVGDVCSENLEPNVCEDSLLIDEGRVVGFYLKTVPPKLKNFIEISNQELLSDRVPKSEMRRSSGLTSEENEVRQFSTIIGSCVPKPHMRRPYPTISSVHSHQESKMFIKAMMMACFESENIIREIMPDQFEFQKKQIELHVPERFRFGQLFTSSISNFNIAAPYHVDRQNLHGCVNVILAKKKHATGGNTTVPDYGATFDSSDNSMLVYPAWRNLHAVTPIKPIIKNGYRNSLVFYPLRGFEKFFDNSIHT